MTAAEYQQHIAGKKPKAIPAPKPVKAVSAKAQMNIVSGKANEALICVTINKKASYAEYRDATAHIVFTFEGEDYILECRPYNR